MLDAIDYDVFEFLYKIEKRYVIYKLNRMSTLNLDMKVILFSHILAKAVNIESKEFKNELMENFNRTKTLI